MEMRFVGLVDEAPLKGAVVQDDTSAILHGCLGLLHESLGVPRIEKWVDEELNCAALS